MKGKMLGKTKAPQEPLLALKSDEDRGIVAVVYQCPNCGDTQTLRYFRSEFVLPQTCCVKCRAGFGNNPGGMFPMVGDEAAPN